MQETECLEEAKTSLESEISSLQQQRDHFEFLLKAHRTLCEKGISDNIQHAHDETCCMVQVAETQPTALDQGQQYSPAPQSAVPLTIKTEEFDDDVSSICSGESMVSPSVVTKLTGSVTYTAVTQSVPISDAVTFAGRPSTLAIGLPTNIASSHVAITTPSRVAITTPSLVAGSVYTIGLDSLMDGHTGLTPLTGVSSIHTGMTPGHTTLTPCSIAHRNSSDSSSNEGLNSPAMLTTL